jgi:hypothetical protein
VGTGFPPARSPWHDIVVWLDVSAGEGRSEKIMLQQEKRDDDSKKSHRALGGGTRVPQFRRGFAL